MEQLAFAEPRARLTDGGTAHEAASVVQAGNAALIQAIRRHVFARGPCTQEEVADALAGDRWTRGTVVSACARAGLSDVGRDVNRRGRRVTLWGLHVQNEMPL